MAEVRSVVASELWQCDEVRGERKCLDIEEVVLRLGRRWWVGRLLGGS
jgi:hypothetical protein